MILREIPQTQISQHMGLSRAQICKEVARARQEWAAAVVVDIDEAKGREIKKLARIEAECWQAWERSKAEGSETLAERIDGMTDNRGRPLGEKRRSMLKKIARDGNQGFLVVIEKCIARRCRILGIDEPVRVAHGGDKDAPPIHHQHTAQHETELFLRQATLEELEELSRLQDQIMARYAGTGQATPGLPPPPSEP